MSDLRSVIHRTQIVTEAYSWLGTPYCHQASQKGVGTDCLGLVRGLWRAVRGEEPEAAPPYSRRWDQTAVNEGDDPLLTAARQHLIVRPTEEMLPGDVLVFRMVRGGPAKHCGVYVGDRRFIHAYDGRAVTSSWLSKWWRARLVGAFSIPLDEVGGQR